MAFDPSRDGFKNVHYFVLYRLLFAGLSRQCRRRDLLVLRSPKC